RVLLRPVTADYERVCQAAVVRDLEGDGSFGKPGRRDADNGVRAPDSYGRRSDLRRRRRGGRGGGRKCCGKTRCAYDHQRNGKTNAANPVHGDLLLDDATSCLGASLPPALRTKTSAQRRSGGLVAAAPSVLTPLRLRQRERVDRVVAEPPRIGQAERP